MISRSKILDFYLDRLSTGFEPSMYQNKLRILRSSLYTILIDLGIPSLDLGYFCNVSVTLSSTDSRIDCFLI